MPDAPRLTSVYLFVRDMATAIAFYQRMGLVVTVFDTFARATMPDGSAGLEFGTAELTRSYDPKWQEPSGPATNMLNFTLASRQAVDDLYAHMEAGGYPGRLAPIDAFWGSRFAIIVDPDGNQVGLHSPQEAAPPAG